MAVLDLDTAQSKLRDWFANKLPQAGDVVISSLRRPGTGASNETFLVDLQWRWGSDTSVEKLVVRWPPGGYKVFPDHAYDMKQQYTLLYRLGGTGIPVPPTRWLEEDTVVIGSPFYIVDRVDGWVPGDFPPYQIAGPLFEASAADKAKTWWSAIDTMSAIHTLDWQKAGLDFLGVPGAGKGYIEQQVAYYEEVFQLNGEPMPDILKTSRDWLLKNSFEPRHLSLCWGDARLGNMIIRDHQVAAVLDWEMACIGDPESDLGWFAHIDWATSVGRPASPFPRMTGLPSMQETIAYYEQATKRKVENLHYYEVLATWRLAILFTRMENSESYLERSKNKKGFITWSHFEKLQNLLGL